MNVAIVAVASGNKTQGKLSKSPGTRFDQFVEVWAGQDGCSSQNLAQDVIDKSSLHCSTWPGHALPTA